MRIKIRNSFTWKITEIYRCEAAWLISQAQLALSLGAVNNLRFSSDASSVASSALEKEREKRKRGKEKKEQRVTRIGQRQWLLY